MQDNAKRDVDLFDHLVIATRDLQAAHDRMQRLGFTLTPRGEHTRLSTINHTVMFSRGNYFELLGFSKVTPDNQMFATALAQRDEAVSAIVPKSQVAEATYERLKDSRFKAQEPVHFSRVVATADGDKDAKFAIVRFDQAVLPVTAAFACCHYTPELVWIPEMLVHANGVVGITELRYRVHRPADAAAIYAELFNAPVSNAPDRSTVNVGDVALVFLQADTAEAVTAIGFATADLAALKATLQRNGIAFTEQSGRVVVAAAEAAGADFEFVAA
jgi:hypothetical protein